MSNTIYLNNGNHDIAISQSHHGSEHFRNSLKTKDLDELTRMLKDPKLKSGERRDVLNEIAERKAASLAAIYNDPNSTQEEKDAALADMTRIIELGKKLTGGTITEGELDEFATLIGLSPSDLDMPEHHDVVETK